MNARMATLDDAEAIAIIFNEGIEDRIATLDTNLRSTDDVRAWFNELQHPIVVVENEGKVIAFANTSSYSPRECYAGIAEYRVYVARDIRGHGAGFIAMQALCEAAEAAGFWKLVSRIFVENTASRAVMQKVGFREVGIHEKHGKLNGVWRDVVIVERLLGAAAT
jgi:L-amino acid N-acyltransferase YncA